MARRSHSTLRTVRFYEGEGLIKPKERSSGGHRKFEPGELRKLQMIIDLRESGMSVDEIKQLMALKSRCTTPECATREMKASLELRIDQLERKIQVLKRVRGDLSSTLDVIQACRGCTDARFPDRCAECEVLDREDLPRAADLLWSN